ncbi:hypothetical protein HYDPIDRAFT_105455 [Hydnomerulius pinastri MD-312]|nr:hypothetical protein HYDPIDRAFT_105455 [Hydnomerulius pinastri MD-312]
MALNERDLSIGGNRGVDIHPGVANPTSHSMHADPLASNFATDPTTEERGAGAGANFQGHKEAQRSLNQTAGVVEGRPGIIESSHIDPLSEDSNKDDGWANVPGGAGTDASSQPVRKGQPTSASQGASAQGVKERLFNVADGAANVVYGVATGDKESAVAGKEALGFGGSGARK